MDIGNCTFWGGDAANPSTLSQSIDISDLAADIDNGLITSSFSVWLQSRYGGTGVWDKASGTLSFVGTGGGDIASVDFTDWPVSQGVYEWHQFTDERVVPSGTRSIEVFLQGRRSSGTGSTDAYFDDAPLVLTSSAAVVPEPLSMAFMGSAFVGVVAWRVRHRRKTRSG